MAQKIDFHFNVPENRIQYACRVVRKARGLGMKIALWSYDAHRLDYFARQLCAFDSTGFYPIVKASDALADQTSTVYDTDADRLPSRDLLILLDDEVPNNFQTLFARFARVIDIVPNQENERQAARKRFVIYRQSGLNPVAHDQGKKD
ncbi:MAG: DNA polymerase III subunit chi [Burkholderiaceae bacterium]|nr:DNA polymerase III subunit chi [Burkholderiaceae bacterium]